MTIATWLAETSRKLDEAGIGTARLDCLVLLEDTLHRDRAALLAHDDTFLDAGKLATLDAAVDRRIMHEPLAYIRGHAAFYGRDFMVTPDVLVPRPETEALVELIKTYAQPVGSLADIGTGSGCLGITLALELDCSNVTVTDVSAAALAIARHNAIQNKVNVNCVEGDLLQPLTQPVDLIATNLPYVPTAYPVNLAAQHEPGLALYAGADGLDLYRQFWIQTGALSQPPHLIATESLPTQHHAQAVMARAQGFVLQSTDGFGQLFSR